MLTRATFHGLVLCGGRSSRMGVDKASIIYSQLSALDQRARCHELLTRACGLAYISCREEQVGRLAPGQAHVVDVPGVEGPAAGLLAAHRLWPQAAWLVLACDFPFVDEAVLQALVQARDCRSAATVFVQNGLREPLLAIWEARALVALEAAARRGGRSPRRVLDTLDCTLLEPPGPHALLNVNSPQDAGMNDFDLSAAISATISPRH